MQQDVSISALGQALLFKRSYNAQSSNLYTNTGAVGYGWTHNYNLRLITSTSQPGGEAGVVVFQGWAGGRFRFLKNNDTNYAPLPGIRATLTRTLSAPYTYRFTTVDQTAYTFNAAGLPTQIREPNGNVTTLTYSGTQLSRVADATSQRYLSFGYDGQGRVYTITDPINRIITYTYDLSGNLALVTDTRGLTWTYLYTGTNQHLLYEVRGPQNTLVERTDYDNQNRAVRQWTNAASQPLQIQYINSVDANGFPTQTVVVTDALERVSIDDYNARGTLIGQYRPGVATGRNYDAAFNWTSSTDANNHSTGYVFDSATGQPKIITDAATFTTSMQYDALNNLTQLVDPRDMPTTYTYSGTLLTRQTDAEGNSTIYTYGQNSLLIAQQDALGRITQFDNGTFGERKAVTVTDASGVIYSVMRYQYDGVGRLITTTDPIGQVTVNAYDNADHLIAVTNNYTTASVGPNYLNTWNLITRYDYDGFGRQIAVTDTLGHVARNYYDPAGRLISTTANFTTTGGVDPTVYNLNTRYGYDVVGNRTLVTDSLFHVMRTEYDDLNRPVTVTQNYKDGAFDPATPDEDIQRITHYDPAGNVIEQIDPPDAGGRQRVTHIWYDSLNRVFSSTANFTTTPGVDSKTYNMTTWYGYDQAGNQVAVTDTLQQTAHTEYDRLNRPVTVTINYKDGVFNSATPDEDIQRITHYDSVGNVVEQIEPPNVNGERRVTRTWYDALNRVFSTTVNFTTTLNADPKTYNLTTWYEYDSAGNQTAITDTVGHVTRNYYDQVGRLISSTVNYSPSLGVNAQNQYNLATQYEYDGVGNRVAITDPANTVMRYGFDALNRMVVMTQNVTLTNGLDPNLYNLVTRYQYDAVGNRLAVTDALTHTTVYTYDAVGRLIAEGSPVIGNVTRYQYDALGRTVVVTDPLTHTMRTYYDAAGRVVSTTNALTGTTVITYDALGRKVGFINENGKSSYTGYDGLGRTIAVTDATTSVTKYGYDAVGNRVVVTDGLTHPTNYTYDIGGRLIAQADALGNTTRYVYDALGNRLVVTDANGIATGYGYDALNRLSVVTESLTTTLGLDATRYNITTTYGYDALSNRTVMTNARGYTTTYTYDALSRLLTLTDPLTHTTHYAYDAVGNRIQTLDANGNAITYTYDALNRNTQIDYRTSLVTYEYDTVGNRKAMTDSLGTTRYLYDELNRLRQVTDPFTGTVQYGYDAVGNRTNLIYPDGKVVTYTFDAANRLTSALDWDGQLTTYTFDQAGRLITTTLPNGVRSVSTYDDANRITRLKHTRLSDGQILGDYQFGLDAVGNRTTATETLTAPMIQAMTTETDFFPIMQDEDDAFVNEWDIDTSTSPIPLGVYWHQIFRAGFRFDQVTLPDQATLQSAELRLTSAEDDGGQATFDVYGESWSNDPYSTFDDFVSRDLTQSSVYWEVSDWYQNTTYAVDVTGIVGEIMQNGWGNGNAIALQVHPNNAWRLVEGGSAVLALTIMHPEYVSPMVTTTIHYVYDPLSHLTDANYSSGQRFQYGYDKVGNRTVQTRTITNTQVANYTYDAANRLSSAGGVNNAWDNNGNLINDGSVLYRYDQANRLISTTLSGVTSLYNYNGDGVRLRQVVAGTPTTYTQDSVAPLPVVLQAKTGATTSKYLYSMGTRPIGQYTSAWEYLLPDALGSVRQIADANGNVTLAESYEPYGSVLTSTGTASSIFGYSGEQADSTTGLIYLRARYMQPTLGMFLSRDPWSGEATQPWTYNGFNYTTGNPVNLSDPSGRQDSGSGIGYFASCFNFHTLETLGLTTFPTPFEDLGNGDFTTAQQAVDICRKAYSKEYWAYVPVRGFDFTSDLPKTAHDLFGWFLYDWRGRFNSDHLYFDARQSLTQELRKTVEIMAVRQMYYDAGQNIGAPDEYQFGLLPQIVTALDFGKNAGDVSLPISTFLGSFWYQVKDLGDGRVGFRIDNDTTLASGTHIALRFDVEDSVERLIERNPTVANRPIRAVIKENPSLVSILRNRIRAETGGQGGGNLYQTYYWAEKRDCNWQWRGNPLNPYDPYSWLYNFQGWSNADMKQATIDPPGFPPG